MKRQARARKALLTIGAPSRIRTCAHGSGEPADLSLRPKQMLASKQFRSAVGTRGPLGVSRPGGECQIPAARSSWLLGQAGLSCGSMPC
jgi:hypothetical protein